MTEQSYQDNPSEFTRREALKKTGAIVGASLWVTPVVQIVTMKPAFAQSTSGPRNGIPPSENGNNGNGTNGNGTNGNGTNEIGTNIVGEPPTVLSENPIPQGDVVEGIVVQAPIGTPVPGVTVIAQTNELPLTGVDADKLGSLAAGMALAGIAALEASKQMEQKKQAAIEANDLG